jgi:hypothetical protein
VIFVEVTLKFSLMALPPVPDNGDGSIMLIRFHGASVAIFISSRYIGKTDTVRHAKQRGKKGPEKFAGIPVSPEEHAIRRDLAIVPDPDMHDYCVGLVMRWWPPAYSF